MEIPQLFKNDAQQPDGRCAEVPGEKVALNACKGYLN